LPTATDQVRPEVAAWQVDPVGFMRDVLGIGYLDPPCGVKGCVQCVPYTRLMAESVRDHRRTIVSACHDSAKTFTAGALVWWWLLSFPPAVVVTSSSTGRQVQRGIWKEIRAHYYRSRFLQDNFPKPNQEDWSYPGEPDWYAFGFSTRPDAAEAGATRVQGQHSPNLLLVFDEATAVDRMIWDAAKGSLTQEHNHWLVLANPTDPTSEFASVWRSGHGWHRIQIDARETPNLIHGDGANPYLVTQRWVDEYVRDNGADHPLVKARVHGILPDDATVTLIGYADLARAYDRKPQPRPAAGWPHVEMGVDVARFGDDLTTIYVVRGAEIVHSERYAKKDTVYTTGAVLEVARAWGLTEASSHRISVDDTGVGGGVTDQLRANGWRGVNGEDFGSAARDPKRFYDRRTELWVALRDWIREEACWHTIAEHQPDERRILEADLPGVTFEMRTKAGLTVMKLEAKKDMKKRLGHSPDHGDALALALASRTARRGLDRSKLVEVARRETAPPDPRQVGKRDDTPKEKARRARKAGIYEQGGAVGGIFR